MRDIKQNMNKYTIQSAFALGPLSIMFMSGSSGSPFDGYEAISAPMLGEGKVAALLTAFAAAKGVTLEEGIIEDVHRLTAGHAGLVCASGRALDTAVPRTHDNIVTLTNWADYAVRTLPLVVRREGPTFDAWPTALQTFPCSRTTGRC